MIHPVDPDVLKQTKDMCPTLTKEQFEEIADLFKTYDCQFGGKIPEEEYPLFVAVFRLLIDHDNIKDDDNQYVQTSKHALVHKSRGGFTISHHFDEIVKVISESL